MNNTHGKIMNREVISRGFTVDHNTLHWLKATVLIALLIVPAGGVLYSGLSRV